MPDPLLPSSSASPVPLRKVSPPAAPSHRDLVGKFEKASSISTSASSLIARSRPGSLKSAKSARDAALESKVLQWIMGIVGGSPPTDFEHFIQDGSVLSKVMTSIVFNSVPLEDIDQEWGCGAAADRVRTLIAEIRRYGVTDVFEVDDLIQLKNVPKVTKCLAQLSKLASSDKDNLLH